MNRNEELNEFLRNLMSCTLDSLNAADEYKYLKQRQEEIIGTLTASLTGRQKDMVDEVLFELGLATEHEAEFLYRQGMKDCVWVLKSLGVLA